MYEATKKECNELRNKYGYTQEQIELLDIESDKVRHGIPIIPANVHAVCNYQTNLLEVRKLQKRWWQFWKV